MDILSQKSLLQETIVLRDRWYNYLRESFQLADTKHHISIGLHHPDLIQEVAILANSEIANLKAAGEISSDKVTLKKIIIYSTLPHILLQIEKDQNCNTLMAVNEYSNLAIIIKSISKIILNPARAEEAISPFSKYHIWQTNHQVPIYLVYLDRDLIASKTTKSILSIFIESEDTQAEDEYYFPLSFYDAKEILDDDSISIATNDQKDLNIIKESNDEKEAFNKEEEPYTSIIKKLFYKKNYIHIKNDLFIKNENINKNIFNKFKINYQAH